MHRWPLRRRLTRAPRVVNEANTAWAICHDRVFVDDPKTVIVVSYELLSQRSIFIFIKDSKALLIVHVLDVVHLLWPVLFQINVSILLAIIMARGHQKELARARNDKNGGSGKPTTQKGTAGKRPTHTSASGVSHRDRFFSRLAAALTYQCTVCKVRNTLAKRHGISLLF